MFRNPRENAIRNSASKVQPSVGRAPSPPGTRTSTTLSAAPPAPAPLPRTMATRTMPARKASGPKQSALPTIGRGSTNAGVGVSVKKTAAASSTKSKTPVKANGKPNASILSFFKPADDGLFIAGGGGGGTTPNGEVHEFVDDLYDENEVANRDEQQGTRYNEDRTSVKRRKLDSPSVDSNYDVLNGSDVATTNGKEEEEVVEEAEKRNKSPKAQQAAQPARPARPALKKTSGPFIEDSDSDSDSDVEEDTAKPLKSVSTTNITPESCPVIKQEEADDIALANESNPGPTPSHRSPPTLEQPAPPRPTLVHEPTSMSTPMEDEFADFEGVEGDFDDDLFEEGDEYMERKYMEQQRRLELEEAGIADEDYDFDDQDRISIKREAPDATEDAASCPICSASLGMASEQEASLHVNACLDGNPIPLPVATLDTPKHEPTDVPERTSTPTQGAERFRRPARPPKPPQANPFAAADSGGAGGSAFSKLMSGHAEDAAWAAASAAEHAARGKPSYQRTCPFYKILPGFNICVDAFRYGAVQGCNAYFLSHFHSDHYIGLTASWTHGPIYCSRVTANLVRQQLRVDPKYVVDLPWEESVDVPGSNGVKVTMIPANHCPGSSLYLFEKPLTKGPSPKLQRVLHCGDFRACPAHIKHPRLMPSIVDSITGKTKQQKIDVCYLDTTYLNPKYAFPSQEEVISACADMCVSLNKVSADESDGWETMKRQRAGEGMVKFVRRESSNPSIKQEEGEEAAAAAEATEDVKPNSMAIQPNGKLASEKSRSRLLVVVGTYSIGKERICVGIARALKSRIYAPAGKQRIVAALEDPELNALMTKNPRDAQVHMTPLFEIRAETLADYLAEYSDSFGRVVGFRPSGWQYRPPGSRFVDSPAVQTVLHSPSWNSVYSMRDLVPQRGSTTRASCFGVPYSEHSSFRELTMFCCALRIEKVIPTVNVGSAKGRERMKGWIDRWAVERKKNGLFEIGEGGGKGEWRGSEVLKTTL